jgi:hypothetical protein
VDRLFVDQAAVATLMEVKKAQNPDVRRKVIGHMLDYGANDNIDMEACSAGDELDAAALPRPCLGCGGGGGCR